MQIDEFRYQESFRVAGLRIKLAVSIHTLRVLLAYRTRKLKNHRLTKISTNRREVVVITSAGAGHSISTTSLTQESGLQQG